MSDVRVSERVETVVIGGGQAGLALGYHLTLRGLDHLILDRNQRVGDAWRSRWDSLRLFTPARYDGLPGMRFPGPSGAYPSKDQVADFLEDYAGRMDLLVRLGVEVERLSGTPGEYSVLCADRVISASNVVVATGAYNQPKVPLFASQLDTSIRQLHSSQYSNPAQIADGPVLVVGAGNSGAEIAMDLAGSHEIWLSGPDTGQEPTRAGSVPDRLLTPLLWLAATRFTLRTPMGRSLRDRFLDPPRGIPLGRIRRKDLDRAGVRRVGRTDGVSGGLPVADAVRILGVRTVIWCTGYEPGYEWIHLPLQTKNGWPVHERGVVESQPGLYFIGLPFLYSLSSALVGGVGRDAAYIAERIAGGVREFASA